MALLENLQGVAARSRQIRDFFGALERLPGLSNWSPPNLEQELISLACLGMLVEATEPLSNLEHFRAAIAAEVRGEFPLSRSDRAELMAAALIMSIWGGGGERIPEKSSRTPDWRIELRTGQSVEVEVTCAEPKQQYLRARESAKQLAELLVSQDPCSQVCVFILDPLEVDSLKAVTEASRSPGDGVLGNCVGKWLLKKANHNTFADSLATFSHTEPPDWWSRSQVQCMVCHGATGPNGSGQATVYYSVSYSSYLNPLQRKAERIQSQSLLPYIVAVDISDLPDALNVLPRAAKDFFPFWDDVSGVLLFTRPGFMPSEAIGKFGWLWKLMQNSSARVSLPQLQHVDANEGANARQRETWFDLDPMVQ